MVGHVRIFVTEPEQEILCGFCDQPISRIEREGAKDRWVGCTSCNNIAELDEAAKVAIDYARHVGASMVDMTDPDVGRIEQHYRSERAFRFLVQIKP